MVILDGPAYPTLNLKTLLLSKEFRVRVIFHEEKETYVRPLLKEVNALNVYRINFLQNLTFMQKVNPSSIF